MFLEFLENRDNEIGIATGCGTDGPLLKEIVSLCSLKKIVRMMRTSDISTKSVLGFGYAKGVFCLNEGRIL